MPISNDEMIAKLAAMFEKEKTEPAWLTTIVDPVWNRVKHMGAPVAAVVILFALVVLVPTSSAAIKSWTEMNESAKAFYDEQLRVLKKLPPEQPDPGGGG